MKILFVANRIPYPPYRGDKLKIFNLAKQLSKKHELHLITFIAEPKEAEYKEELLKYYKTVTLVSQPKWKSYLACLMGIFSKVPFQVLYFKNNAFQRTLNSILDTQTFDAIHVQHLRMAQYFINKIPKTRIILDLPDAFSLYWHRRISKAKHPLNKMLLKVEHQRLLSYEKHLSKFDLNLACSQEDINYLKSKHGLSAIALLSNGVDTSVFKPSTIAPIENRILFTGNMDYAPNIDGAAYFVEEILPMVLRKIPAVQFVIAGQRPVKRVKDLAGKHVTITGFIPKLDEMYATAAVVVAPLRIGAGTQNKVLESMAMGIPVVCTNIGFEGLGVVNGDGIYKEVESVAFANRVIELLENKELRSQVGQRAHEIISNKFSWEQIAFQLEQYLSNEKA